MAAAAQAHGPAKFFLRSPHLDDEDGEPSFDSFGSSMRSTDISYDYRQEEEYVRAAQANGGKARRVSEGKKKKGNDGDMPYRPGEDDWQPDPEDSAGEGEGIVRGGGLDGRAGTRGTRAERGEGHMGLGLGIQRRPRREAQMANGDTGSGDEMDGMDDYREQTPMNAPATLKVQHTPNGNGMAYRRSPTPAQTLVRAFSPHLRAEKPQFPKRTRHPSSGRTVVTNTLYGVVLTMRFFVELFATALSALLLHPMWSLGGLVRKVMKQAKTDWWKWLGGLLALSLSLRMLDSPWWRGIEYAAPSLPPKSLEELVGRLQHLEKAVTLLSDSSKALADAEKIGKDTDASLIHRIGELESSISAERKRLDSVKSDETVDIKSLRKSMASIKAELGDLGSRVGKNEAGLSSTEGRIKQVSSLERDVRVLSDRVDVVEKDVKSALDDGRFRAALERILPHSMPVKRNSHGTIDVDPVFWTEMKKVLIGRGEVDEIIRKALKTSPQPGEVVDPWKKSDADLEEWGNRLLERKTAEGVILTRRDFVELLESEVTNLKHIIDTLPRHAPSTSPKKSPITIKSGKGEDVTSILQDLIDAALLKYSKDTLARSDFALFSAGARVVPSITSDSLVMRQPSTLGKVLLGRRPIEGRSPATALHPDNSVGSCWPFKGSQGQLGIMLNRRVVITDLTVEHAASELAMDISTAPRDIEVVSGTLKPCFKLLMACAVGSSRGQGG